jgi:hypothetical protein
MYAYLPSFKTKPSTACKEQSFGLRRTKQAEEEANVYRYTMSKQSGQGAPPAVRHDGAGFIVALIVHLGVAAQLEFDSKV